MEISESGSCVRVKHRRIDIGIVIINEASLCGLIDQSILQHVLASQEDRQPLVVADVLVLRNVDFARLLEDHLVVPLRINLLKIVGDSVVLAEQNNLQDGESWILIDTRVAAQVASLLRCLNVAGGRRVGVLRRPLVAASIVDQHSSAGEGANWAVLLLRVSVHQRQIEISRDDRQLFGWASLRRAFAVVVAIGQGTNEVHALGLSL